MLQSNSIAIRVESLSKRYRIGLKEEVHDTLAGAVTDWVKQPGKNLRRLRHLTRFGENGHEPEDIIWALKDVSFEVKRGEVVGINGRMPSFVVGKIADVLNNDRKAVNGSRILILGVAYKPDVGDTRESPALEIIRRLRKRGAAVAYHDPFVPHLLDEEFVLESVDLTPPILNTADCVVIVTNHRAFDYEMILDFSPLIVDTRNALKGMEGDGRVVTL